jgi:hypothetical protein
MVAQIRVKLSYTDGEFILPVNPKSVKVAFERRIVQHEVPGREGDIIQDLGSKSKVITFSGVFMTTRGSPGYDADAQTMDLLKKFEDKDVMDLTFPIPFSSIGIGSTKVVIKNVSISDEAGRNDYKDYEITCVEWRPTEIKQNKVNLVNAGPLSKLKTVLQNRGFG